MFCYNEWSDLLNSNLLVMPLRKDGDEIICITENEETVKYRFEDFDFDKLPEERTAKIQLEIEEAPIIQISISESELIEYTPTSLTADNFVINFRLDNPKLGVKIKKQDYEYVDLNPTLAELGWKLKEDSKKVNLDTSLICIVRREENDIKRAS